MKAYIGVDAESGLIHAAWGTAANVNDATQATSRGQMPVAVVRQMLAPTP